MKINLAVSRTIRGKKRRRIEIVYDTIDVNVSILGDAHEIVRSYVMTTYPGYVLAGYATAK